MPLAGNVTAPRLAPTEATRRWAAVRRQRVEVDPLVGPRCASPMRIVACITQAAVIGQIAKVSMPLLWSEVNTSLDPRAFTIRTALSRMEQLGADPVIPVLTDKPDLQAVLTRLAALMSEV